MTTPQVDATTPAEPDLFGPGQDQPGARPAKTDGPACYQVQGTLQHDAEVRFLARNDGVHTHALVLDLVAADTGGHIHAEQPFKPLHAPQFERLAKNLKRGAHVQLTAGLFGLCLHLPHVQQVQLLTPSTPSTH